MLVLQRKLLKNKLRKMKKVSPICEYENKLCILVLQPKEVCIKVIFDLVRSSQLVVYKLRHEQAGVIVTCVAGVIGPASSSSSPIVMYAEYPQQIRKKLRLFLALLPLTFRILILHKQLFDPCCALSTEKRRN